jgi:hypothetical protein
VKIVGKDGVERTMYSTASAVNSTVAPAATGQLLFLINRGGLVRLCKVYDADKPDTNSDTLLPTLQASIMVICFSMYVHVRAALALISLLASAVVN